MQLTHILLLHHDVQLSHERLQKTGGQNIFSFSFYVNIKLLRNKKNTLYNGGKYDNFVWRTDCWTDGAGFITTRGKSEKSQIPFTCNFLHFTHIFSLSPFGSFLR